MEAGLSQQVAQLTEVDVPGAPLVEPMDKHSIPALKWWLLLCYNIKMPSSVRKWQLPYNANRTRWKSFTVA